MPHLVHRMAVFLFLASLEYAQAQMQAGPYIQNTNETKAAVIWYTPTHEPGVLRYGKQNGQWEGTLQAAAGLVHRIEISGLQPNTKYFYEIGNGAQTHASGEAYYFRTHPRPGSKLPFRFMAFGDFGTGDEHQKATAEQLLKDDARHEFALLLGDLIYSQGEREKYLVNYFPVYQNIIRHRPWWPTLGNHDVKSENGAAYFEFFETPANNALRVENYYSFDYANAHFVSLDGELLFENAADLQRQLEWLRQDLRSAKNRGQRWLIALWHRPPYSGGSHDDDNDIQREFVPVVEDEGVDLILNGHSHVAERSFLLNKHQIINQSLSQYPKKGFDKGTVYVVSGAGGEINPIENAHPLMAFQLGGITGYESIYIHGDTLRGGWITHQGQVKDQFTLIKSGGGTSVELIEDEIIPKLLATHYPNPLRASQPGEELRINFEIFTPTPVTAMIYDIMGREVMKLETESIYAPGRHVLRWNGQKQGGGLVTPGLYFYRLQAGLRVYTAKFVLLP